MKFVSMNPSGDNPRYFLVSCIQKPISTTFCQVTFSYSSLARGSNMFPRSIASFLNHSVSGAKSSAIISFIRVTYPGALVLLDFQSIFLILASSNGIVFKAFTLDQVIVAFLT
ncbi:hypothetical protein HOF65_04925 [bacterium]|nr:hypothetical protein [bacterium]